MSNKQLFTQFVVVVVKRSYNTVRVILSTVSYPDHTVLRQASRRQFTNMYCTFFAVDLELLSLIQQKKDYDKISIFFNQMCRTKLSIHVSL